MSVRGLSIAMSRGAAAAAIKLPFHLFHPRAIAPHDLFDVSDTIKVEFQLVQLSEDIMIALYFGISSVDEVPSPVKLRHGKGLALLAQVYYLLLDLRHDAVKIPPECRQGGAIED